MQRWRKRVRSPNFTIEEKDLLVEIINRHRHILDNNRADHNTIEMKHETWLQVATEFNKDATTQRSWRCLKTAFENIKKKIKKEKMALSDTSDGQAMDGTPQMPLNVVLDIEERDPSTSNRGRIIIKVENEEYADEELETANKGKTDGRGLIENASTIPLAQWENWPSGHHDGATCHTGEEPVACSPQRARSVPEQHETTLGRSPPVPNTPRPVNRLIGSNCKQRKRTALHKRVANDRKSRNFVELALVKRRYYSRLLEIAEEQHKSKMRMAEMAEEQHTAKLKMMEAKTNCFLKKLRK